MKKIIYTEFISNADKLDVSEMKLIKGGCEWLHDASWAPKPVCKCESQTDDSDRGGLGSQQYMIACSDGRSMLAYNCREAESFCRGLEYGCYPH